MFHWLIDALLHHFEQAGLPPMKNPCAEISLTGLVAESY